MSNLFDLPCFVINLKERKDRWEKMMKGLVNFKNIIRCDAVNVKNISIDELPVSLMTRYIIDDNKRRCHHFQLHTKGAIGASLSHIGCWRYIVENGIEEAVIFEDDCYLKPEMFGHIQNCYEKFDKDIFVFGYTKIYNKEKIDDCFSKAESYIGAHAYVITNEGARRLLRNSLPIELHLDAYIGLMIFYNYLEGVYITNNQIKQNYSKTDIQTNYCIDCLEPSNSVVYKSKRWIIKYIWIVLIINILIFGYCMLRKERK
jgi:GR25 family glycosyltransferase involved in LPS biosynthesis